MYLFFTCLFWNNIYNVSFVFGESHCFNNLLLPEQDIMIYLHYGNASFAFVITLTFKRLSSRPLWHRSAWKAGFQEKGGFYYFLVLFISLTKLSLFFLYTDYLKNLLEESADYRDTQGKCLFRLKKSQFTYIW